MLKTCWPRKDMLTGIRSCQGFCTLRARGILNNLRTSSASWHSHLLDIPLQGLQSDWYLKIKKDTLKHVTFSLRIISAYEDKIISRPEIHRIKHLRKTYNDTSWPSFVSWILDTANSHNCMTHTSCNINVHIRYNELHLKEATRYISFT